MKTINLTTEIEVFESSEELKKADNLLIEEAMKIAQDAYAPYSKFNVGAAVLLANGKIITGNNQENAAYPSGLCAERVALFYANAQYPNIPVEAMAIIAMTKDGIMPDPITPCGACRQVMIETETRMRQEFYTLLVGNKMIYKVKSSKDLMPMAFEIRG